MSDDPRPLGGRLPLLAPADLDDEQRAVHEAIAGGRRAGGPFRLADDEGHLLGPFNAMLHAPVIGDAVQRLGAALRFAGQLPARTRELVICAVAAHWGSEYEWYAHERVARGVGVTTGELERLRVGELPADLAAPEQAALLFTHALLRDRAVDDELYDVVRAHYGHAELVELSVLVGYYQMLAGLLAAADVPAPQDAD